ncbi:MAG: hypothetical protein WCO44_09265 [Bacteroidota bacterium]
MWQPHWAITSHLASRTGLWVSNGGIGAQDALKGDSWHDRSMA